MTEKEREILMADKELKSKMDEFYSTTDLYYKKLVERFEDLKKSGLKVGFIDIMKLAEKKQKILDCGCGSGSLCIYLSKRLNKRTYGVDISRIGINLAEEMAEKTNADCEFKVADIEIRIPYPNNFFDLVIMHELLEHLVYPDKAIGEVARVLKNGGLFILISPNLFLRQSFPVMIKKVFQWIKMFFQREYLPKTLLNPKLNGNLGGDSDAVYLTNPIEIRRMLNMCGLRIVKGSYVRCLFVGKRSQ